MSRAWSVRLMTAGIYVLLLGIHYQSTSVICKRVTTGFLSVHFRYLVVLILKVVSRGNLPIVMVDDVTRDNNNDKKKSI